LLAHACRFDQWETREEIRCFGFVCCQIPVVGSEARKKMSILRRMLSKKASVEEPEGPQPVQEDAPTGEHTGEEVEVQHLGQVFFGP
jgi:hypothetical protein